MKKIDKNASDFERKLQIDLNKKLGVGILYEDAGKYFFKPKTEKDLYEVDIKKSQLTGDFIVPRSTTVDISAAVDAVKKNLMRNHPELSGPVANKMTNDFLNKWLTKNGNVTLTKDFDNYDVYGDMVGMKHDAKRQKMQDFENEILESAKTIKKLRNEADASVKKVYGDYFEAKDDPQNNTPWAPFYKQPREKVTREGNPWNSWNKTHDFEEKLTEDFTMEGNLMRSGPHDYSEDLYMNDLKKDAILVNDLVSNKIRALKQRKGMIQQLGMGSIRTNDFEAVDFYNDAKEIKNLIKRISKRLKKGE